MTLANNAALAQEIPMRENACALIMHGLNTNPERMSDIAALLDANNFKTLIGRLTGHDKKHLPNEVISSEQWKTDFMSQWKEATSECSGEKQQRVFVGYSLGALTALTSFDTDKGLQLPTKMILFLQRSPSASASTQSAHFPGFHLAVCQVLTIQITVHDLGRYSNHIKHCFNCMMNGTVPGGKIHQKYQLW